MKSLTPLGKMTLFYVPSHKLDVPGPGSDAGARALLESPHLGGLWWLGIRRGGLSRPTLTALRRRFGSYVGTVSGL